MGPWIHPKFDLQALRNQPLFRLWIMFRSFCCNFNVLSRRSGACGLRTPNLSHETTTRYPKVGSGGFLKLLGTCATWKYRQVAPQAQLEEMPTTELDRRCEDQKTDHLGVSYGSGPRFWASFFWKVHRTSIDLLEKWSPQIKKNVKQTNIYGPISRSAKTRSDTSRKTSQKQSPKWAADISQEQSFFFSLTADDFKQALGCLNSKTIFGEKSRGIRWNQHHFWRFWDDFLHLPSFFYSFCSEVFLIWFFSRALSQQLFQLECIWRNILSGTIECISRSQR